MPMRSLVLVASAFDFSDHKAAAYAPQMTLDMYLAFPEDASKLIEVVDGWIVRCESAEPSHQAIQLNLLIAIREAAGLGPSRAATECSTPSTPSAHSRSNSAGKRWTKACKPRPRIRARGGGPVRHTGRRGHGNGRPQAGSAPVGRGWGGRADADEVAVGILAEHGPRQLGEQLA
jgi:hypothetical protein